MDPGEEDENPENTISRIITGPIEFVKSLIPSCTNNEEEVKAVEKVIFFLI